MGRKAEPGISYYRLNCSHIRNKKVRLLFNEYDANGYWIWQCILATAYEGRGYFFDHNDKESLELFATDVCKKQVSLVEEVITGCLRRGLFEQTVFEMFGILTSEMMQQVYIDATAERRRKGTGIEMIKEFLLVNISEDDTRNILIVPWNNEIVPRNKDILPPNNPQSKVEKSKADKSKVSGAKALVAAGAAPHPNGQAEKNKYKELIESLKGKEVVVIWTGIKDFITNEKPEHAEPYVDAWNIFAGNMRPKLPIIETITDSRKKKLKTRLTEVGFDYLRVLEKIKESPHLKGSNDRGWRVTFDWIIENDKNYIKILEGNYN